MCLNEIKAGGPTVTKVPLQQCASAERVLTTVPVPLAPLPPPSSLRSPPPPSPFAPPPRSLPPSPPPSPQLGVQSSQRQRRTTILSTRIIRHRHRS